MEAQNKRHFPLITKEYGKVYIQLMKFLYIGILLLGCSSLGQAGLVGYPTVDSYMNKIQDIPLTQTNTRLNYQNPSQISSLGEVGLVGRPTVDSYMNKIQDIPLTQTNTRLNYQNPSQIRKGIENRIMED